MWKNEVWAQRSHYFTHRILTEYSSCHGFLDYDDKWDTDDLSSGHQYNFWQGPSFCWKGDVTTIPNFYEVFAPSLLRRIDRSVDRSSVCFLRRA